MQKKFILAPDSFKGSMASAEICGIMKDRIRHFYPQAEIFSIPVADGGEGTVDALTAALNGRKIPARAAGPFFLPVDSFYGVTGDGTAVVEMAACAGLPLAGEHPDPLAATTYGVGELIRMALDGACKKIAVGLGGSCTNDAGTGMAAALGVRFFDDMGKEFVPTGGTLEKVRHVDVSSLDARLRQIELVAMCDIDNPLYGKNGAAFVFAPQKGADGEGVALLDAGLRHICGVIASDLNMDVSGLPGGGAAGGMGAGMSAFLGAGLCSGIDAVLDLAGFDERLKGADMVFTGEGKLDSQSLRGKTIAGIAKRAKRAGVPVVAVVGDVGESAGIYPLGVTAVFSINRMAVPFGIAKRRCRGDLADTMDDILRLLRCASF